MRTEASNFTAPSQVDITQWVAVDEAALPPARQRQFRNRKRAIVLYLDGANEAQLLHETGLKRRNVYRIIVERCWVGAAHCPFCGSSPTPVRHPQ